MVLVNILNTDNFSVSDSLEDEETPKKILNWLWRGIVVIFNTIIQKNLIVEYL